MVFITLYTSTVHFLQWTRRTVLCHLKDQSSSPLNSHTFHHPLHTFNDQSDTLAAQALLELASSGHTVVSIPLKYSLHNGIVKAQTENNRNTFSVDENAASLNNKLNAPALNGDISNDRILDFTIEHSPEQGNVPQETVKSMVTDNGGIEPPTLGLEHMDIDGSDVLQPSEDLLVNGTIGSNGDDVEAIKKECDDLDEENDDVEVVDVVDCDSQLDGLEATNEESDMEVDVGGPRTTYNVGFGELLYTLYFVLKQSKDIVPSFQACICT